VSRRAAIPLLLLLALPAAYAQSAGPVAPRTAAAIAAIDACVRRLDPELDVGLGRIEPLCPRLAATLEASGVAALLPSDWKRPRSELSVSGLRALRRALFEPVSLPARRAPPDTGLLRSLVDETGASAAIERGPWARFTRWLRSLVEGLDPQAASRSPKERFGAASLPQRVWRVLGYAGVVALLAFAAWLLRAELTAAGVLGRSRDGGRRAARDQPVQDATGTLSEVALLERPAWLLRRLAEALQHLGRLPAAGALTPRELARNAQLEAAADRDPLQAIAAAAEQVRFAAQPPAPRELEPAIEAAAALLQRLGERAAAVTGGDAAPAAGSVGARR